MLKLRHAVIVLLALGLAGCAAYINIPSEKKDAAGHSPNWDYTAHAMSTGVKAALSDQTITAPFLVVLPPGSSQETYNLVLPEINPQATWSGVSSQPGPTTAPAPGGGVMLLPPQATTLPTDRAVVEVAQVRIRGWSGQIDVVRPMDLNKLDSPRQVVTAYLKWDPVSHWQVVQTRAWRMSVQDALRTSPEGSEPELAR